MFFIVFYVLFIATSWHAPDSASIFTSFLHAQNLPLGTQLGAIMALSFASRRPKKTPGPPMKPLRPLRMRLCASIDCQNAPGLLQGPFLVDFWSFFGSFFNDSWLSFALALCLYGRLRFLNASQFLLVDFGWFGIHLCFMLHWFLIDIAWFPDSCARRCWNPFYAWPYFPILVCARYYQFSSHWTKRRNLWSSNWV